MRGDALIHGGRTHPMKGNVRNVFAMLCVSLAGAAEPSGPATKASVTTSEDREVLIVGEEKVSESDLIAGLPQEKRQQIERAILALEEAERRALRDLFAERYLQQEMERRGITRDALLADELSRSRGDFSPHQRGEIARLSREISAAEQAGLDAVIESKLLEQAAKRRGVAVDTLLATEVEKKVEQPSGSEIQLIVDYEEKLRGGWRSREELAKQAASSLRDLRLARRRQEFLASLRSETPVRVLMSSPRAAVAPDPDRMRGSKDAPVQIVVFSDFECPYCARVETVLNQVRARYDGKIAVTFRDFPLPMHSSAETAAEAANCAGMQGKYWEYHDALFADQARLSPPDLRKHAETLDLDMGLFDACIEAGETKPKIAQDMEDGAASGVAGTPTVFVNGRLIDGAPDIENISRLIDAELQNHGIHAVPALAASPSGRATAR